EDLLQQCDFPLPEKINSGNNLNGIPVPVISRAISLAELQKDYKHLINGIAGKQEKKVPVIGITGIGGAGKSSVTDELIRRMLDAFPQKSFAVISVDPSRRNTGGALLGDRIRMNSIFNPRVYMRSLATRENNLALSKYVDEALQVLKAAQFDLIILETSGIGQSDTEILDHSDASLYIMTPEFGAATQ